MYICYHKFSNSIIFIKVIENNRKIQIQEKRVQCLIYKYISREEVLV